MINWSYLRKLPNSWHLDSRSDFRLQNKCIPTHLQTFLRFEIFVKRMLAETYFKQFKPVILDSIKVRLYSGGYSLLTKLLSAYKHPSSGGFWNPSYLPCAHELPDCQCFLLFKYVNSVWYWFEDKPPTHKVIIWAFNIFKKLFICNMVAFLSVHWSYHVAVSWDLKHFWLYFTFSSSIWWGHDLCDKTMQYAFQLIRITRRGKDP